MFGGTYIALRGSTSTDRTRVERHVSAGTLLCIAKGVYVSRRQYRSADEKQQMTMKIVGQAIAKQGFTVCGASAAVLQDLPLEKFPHRYALEFGRQSDVGHRRSQKANTIKGRKSKDFFETEHRATYRYLSRHHTTHTQTIPMPVICSPIPKSIAELQERAITLSELSKTGIARLPLLEGAHGSNTARTMMGIDEANADTNPANARTTRTNPGTARVEVQVTRPALTGLDLARWHSLECGVMALDHSLRTRAATYSEIRTLANHLRNSHGSTAIQHAKLLATPHSESPMESVLKVEMWRRGYERPLQQAEIFDLDGAFLGRADFYFPRAALVVEYDGQGKYAGEFGQSGDEARTAEYERQRALHNAGLAVVRVGTGVEGVQVRLDKIARRHQQSPNAGQHADVTYQAAGYAWREE